MGELAEMEPLPREEPLPKLVRRAAHAELELPTEIAPGERFAVSAWVDTDTADDERSAELLLRPLPGIERLELQVWLVVTPHFEILGEPIRPLPLDLREESSPRLRFEIDALAHDGALAAEPLLRLLFSHGTWLAGEVAVDVPLAVPAEAAS
jgi:hypothetical protein